MRFDCRNSDLSFALVMADMFGFDPPAEKWRIPDGWLLREGIPTSCASWDMMFFLVPCVEADEASGMAAALRVAANWLMAKPQEFPVWFDRSKRYRGWEGLWVESQEPRWPDFLTQMASSIDGHPFKVITDDTKLFAALVDCDYEPPPKPKPPPPPPFPLEPDPDPTIPGLEDPKNPEP